MTMMGWPSATMTMTGWLSGHHDDDGTALRP
jgi:hypothetical protein